MSDIMSPIIPDLKKTAFGISSPRSRTEGYSCAFPSWPNRPWLDSRRQFPEPVKHSVPSREFVESLRQRPLPENVFEDDEDDDFISEPSTSSTNSSASSTPTLSAIRRPVQRSNSLLSRALSQLHQETTGRAA
ncbi:hypothetical protein FN846DRAFT_166527 [Sphaerosporella brunnea]|uniref:Uncharacterized protein n=1 Tax=Sphaerosporella brunnea TaxID=1250544 RepID=A0A5J5EQ18_9PEZI|nr:hypothetical protein FN846DRAFT_166527 [Sphaerosporella brunnea]